MLIWKVHLEEGINCCGNGIFSVASASITVESASPHVVPLPPEDVSHLHEGVGGSVPVPRQLVLSNCPLVTIQAPLDITSTKQGATGMRKLGLMTFGCNWR